jgi:lipase
MTVREVLRHDVAGLSVADWPGTAPVVVALPGLTSSSVVWRPLADALPAARVVSPDLRGRGLSRDRPGPTGLRAHAKDVAAVLAGLDLSDVVLVGHSMGAYLAPLVAQEAGGRVQRLVLVDGGVRPAFPFFMGPRLTRLAFRRELGALARDWPDAEALARKTKLDKVIASRPELRPVLLQLLEEEAERTPGGLRPRLDVARAVDDAVDTFWGTDQVQALVDAAVPVDLLVAENARWDGAKPFLSDAAIAPLRERLPDVSVSRLPGNHLTVLFAPELAAAVGR